MARITVVEDETAIRELIRLNLELAGYEVQEAKDGLEGLNLIRNGSTDLVLLDIMMPKMDGYTLLEELKKNNIAVICLTAKDSVRDKVKGLELGADDYMTKPFDSMELLARVKAVLRRTGVDKASDVAKAVSYRDIVLEPDQHRVSKNGQEVPLTLKEFELLAYLIDHKGNVLTREQLLSQIWGYDYEGNTRTVDMHVQRLRTKLALDTIKTVYKVGYRLEE
ncbi:MAG: response regulator transcription factor [Clostridiales bacterium]|uniref:Stage 0 sporulation protein A homolog n=1 Tax=Peptococcus niger TaxID=2741 RepID=A0A1G6XR77_PEPNI|nr:response regulator transcription factor [Peptococcus niger]MBS5915858.1 response regulator transcription factor [Clostridiales bacterium]MDU7505226.1 response regulator transcription factor [Clostridia bacterium]MDU1029101.1 response regulator transcription factor [Clostridiales bacterium]MDU2293312.1 response regulator transcription factor [Peptococcus niger]MDU5952383.1 response regulator transcription factor [Clostridiales bacterium]